MHSEYITPISSTSMKLYVVNLSHKKSHILACDNVELTFFSTRIVERVTKKWGGRISFV